MPRISKKFALLLVLAMLATMFVGMGTVSASATYSAGTIMSVSSGTADQDLGRVKVSIPASELTTDNWVDFRLPTDFKFNTINGNLTNTGVAGTYDVAGDSHIQFEFPAVKNAFMGATATNIQVEVLGDNEIKVNFPGANGLWMTNTSEDTGYFYLVLKQIHVDSSSPTSIPVNITGNAGSPFVDGSVIVATYGSGTVNLSLDSVKTITDSIYSVDNIRIKEDRPGAWDVGETIKLKLPSGFKWYTGAAYREFVAIDDPGNIYTNIGPSFTDDDRTLVLTNNNGAKSTSAAYFMVKKLGIDIDDETIAKTGDVLVDVSGTATAAPTSFTVAKYGDYSVSAYAVGDPEQVVAGGVQQKIGKFAIEESVKESLDTNKTIIATLVGGAKWDFTNTQGPKQDTANTKNWGPPFQGGTNWAFVGTGGDVIKYKLGDTKSTDAIKAVFEKGEIAVAPDAEDQIKVVLSGSAGVTGEIVVANVIKPATISTDGGAVESAIGMQTVAINPILITENIKEGFNFDPNSALPIYKKIRIEFPVDVVPTNPTDIEVTSGDLVINDSQTGTSLLDGKWGVDMVLKSTSSSPATIKVSGIKLDLLRSVPEGDILAKLKGGAIVKTAYATDNWGNAFFPSTGTISSTPVVKVVTQAPQDTVREAAFVVGSTTYTIAGQELTADVAPYIKDSRTYVPVAYLANALGVETNNIMWDAASQTVTLMRGDGKIVQLKIGSKIIYINGVPVAMDVAPEITNSRTFLPAGFVAQAFGAKVDWDAATSTVTIS